MQGSVSVDCPLARESGRRTTERKLTSVSPLGRVLTSAGADSFPRSTTSFRSITATLMRAASPSPHGRPRHTGGLWTGPAGVDDAAPSVGDQVCRWSGLSVVRSVGGQVCRWSALDVVLESVGLAQQLGDLGLDVLVEVVVVGPRIAVVVRPVDVRVRRLGS